MAFAPEKIRVGVLRGGPSNEYHVSLNTGSCILSNLPDEYEPVDIFISRDGLWHIGGLTKNPEKVLQSIDVALNAMHGQYGEDGQVQKILEHFKMPYTGSDSLSSAVGMNKALAKNVFKNLGFKTPHHLLISQSDVTPDLVKEVNESIPFPLILKPVNSGSSIGVRIINNHNETRAALRAAMEIWPKIIIEEFISGREATCGVIEGFRGKDLYTLMPIEVFKDDFHDYDSKHFESGFRYSVPGNFSDLEKMLLQEQAAELHKALGLRHYSRSDFILHPKRGIFVLEVNSLPELTHRSAFMKSLESVGSNIKEFLSHLLKTTLSRN